MIKPYSPERVEGLFYEVRYSTRNDLATPKIAHLGVALGCQGSVGSTVQASRGPEPPLIDGGHPGGAGSQWCNRLPARTKGGSV